MRILGGAVALAILTTRAALAVCTPRYEAPAFYEGSPSPRVIRVANLNGDQWPDLVVGNHEINREQRGLSWHMGAPGARYESVQVTASDTTFRSIAVADFDRDRDDDVVAVAFGDGGVRLFRNDGGRLVHAATFETESFTDVAAGDFNGDARPDFVIVNDGEPTMRLMLGAGDGVTFNEQPFFMSGARFRSWGVAAADFNGDGRDDLVVPHSLENTLVVLFGASSGYFVAPVVHTFDFPPGELYPTDLDGDHTLDLLVTFAGYTPAATIRNVRAGAQATVTKFGPLFINSDRYAVGDFDGDGLADVVGGALGGMEFYRGTSSGFVLTSTWMMFGADATGAWDFAVADLDLDGDQDVAAATIEGVAILRNHGDGTFDVPRFNAEPNAVADFTGDGKPDLLVELTVLRGVGDGTFAGTPPVPTDLAYFRPAVGDLNGDGRLDVVYVFVGRDEFGRSQPMRMVALNAGDGTFVRYEDPIRDRRIEGPPRLADLNGDGNLDLLFILDVPSAFDAVSIALGRGDGNFHPPSEIAGWFEDVVPGDFDGDGRVDLLLVAINGQSSIVLGRGDGTFGIRRDIGYLSGEYVVVTDLNGDNRDDIVVSDFNSTLVMIQQDAVGSFDRRDIYLGEDFYAEYNIVTDLNGDSIPDIFVGEETDTTGRDGRAMILFGTGNGAFREPAPLRTVGVAPIFISDLDVDGRLDLVDAGYVRLNTGCFVRRRSGR